jgi:Rrf2 family protein
MAQHPESSHITQKIAEATKVPAGYLSKVLQSLSRAGLVKSQRGLGGGFVLAVSAEELSVYDIVQAVDPLQRIRRCPLGIPSHSGKLCVLHQKLDDAMAAVEQSLRDAKVGELLNEAAHAEALCSIPLQEKPSKALTAKRKA